MERQHALKNQFEHKPLYEELVEEFCRRITLGRWPVGRPLKTEATIAAELGVSLGTVRRAFDRLEGMNLIDRTPGRGTVVRELDCTRRLASLINVVDREGTPVAGEIAIQSVDRIDADRETVDALRLGPNQRVLRIVRSRSHSGRTFSVETAFVPFADAAEMPEFDTVWASARNFVVFGDIAVKRGEYVRVVSAQDAAGVAQFADCGAALLEVHRTLFAFDGRPLEYCKAYCQLGSELRYKIA